MKDSIDVKSSSGSYKVSVGRSIFKQALQQIKQTHSFEECFLFVDENVWIYHQEQITDAFHQAGYTFQYQVIPEGEQSKTVSQWKKLVDYLLRSGVRRNTPLFAIGGGVTGDLSGFVASATMRGIPLVHLPTTLLAMVDSSIGGKTGVNHETGKNLIGSFYQPLEVIADLDFLETLPPREWQNGLSEILKYGAIRDKQIIERSTFFLEEDRTPARHPELTQLVLDCAQIKARVVEEDEFEAGTRAHLNFGHTFAHAMEKAADFSKLSHGEAVYLGMLASIHLSNLTGSALDDAPLRKFRNLYSFKITGESLNISALLQTMKRDKKVVDDNYRFILLHDWQQPAVVTVTKDDLIQKAWLTIRKELS